MEGNESNPSTRSERAKKLFLGGSKYSWLAMLALWLVFAMNSNFRNFFFLVQPSIIAEFSTDAETMGLIAAIITLAQSVLVLPGSAWSDRGGHGWARKYREIPMALGYMIFSILSGVKGFTQSLTSITILQSIKNMFGEFMGECRAGRDGASDGAPPAPGFPIGDRPECLVSRLRRILLHDRQGAHHRRWGLVRRPGTGAAISLRNMKEPQRIVKG
jgi:hypothetical protein